MKIASTSSYPHCFFLYSIYIYMCAYIYRERITWNCMGCKAVPKYTNKFVHVSHPGFSICSRTKETISKE